MPSSQHRFSCQSTSGSSWRCHSHNPPSLSQKLSCSSTSLPHISTRVQSHVNSPIRSLRQAVEIRQIFGSSWRWRTHNSSTVTMSPRHLSKTFRIQSQSPSRKLQIRCLNTFLPYPEFDRSVACLDNRRLGKQRVEAWQILRIVKASPVAVPGQAWANSPAVRMWRGFPDALSIYYNYCLLEWDKRGFKNVILQPVVTDSPAAVMLPPWLGDEQVHASHRSNLLRKEAEHYNQFGWTESPDMPYLWPVPIIKISITEVSSGKRVNHQASM